MLKVLHRLGGDSIWGRRLRAAMLVVVLALGAWKFAGIVHEHYPVQRWLFWLYAKYWLLCAFWSASVLSFGHFALKAILKRVLPVREHIVLSFATGVFSFFLLMFLCGLLGLFGRGTFVALPVAMFGLGARSSYRYGRRLYRHLRPRMRRATSVIPWWGWLFAGYGLIAVVLLYANIMIPENMAFDTRWYHLSISENYAAAGRVTKFPEGWYMGAYPHLASILYTWPFLMPWSMLFDRVMLCSHLDFTIFLWTLAAIPALVRRLVPRTRAGFSWVAVFLFPGIFLYDASLCTNADHILAFWAVPIYLALLRAWSELEPRRCLLLAAFMSGAINTKYTAIALVAFPMLAVAFRALILFVRGLRGDRNSFQRAWSGPATALVAGLILTSPHWAKNWIFYGSPMYPALYKYLPVHPWSAEAAARYELSYAAGWRPPRNMAGVKETLQALYKFSFEPHDWASFHGAVPVFGSLFTLTVLCLPFLRKTSRVWGLYLAGHLAVLVWYWVQHEDRYLQNFMPWMACGVAAVLILIWRSGWAPRAAAVALVGLQVIWGGDIYFFPTHSMIFTSPIKQTADLLASGFRKDYETRLRPFTGPAEVARKLRNTDVLLVHDEMPHLGFRVRTVQDFPVDQAGIIYQSLRSPKALYDLLVSYDVTHVVYGPSKEHSSLADDLVFYDFVVRHTIEHQTPAGWNLSKLSATAPTDDPFGDIVAVYSCGAERYKSGLYHLRDTTYFPGATVPDSEFPKPFAPAPSDSLRDQQLERADFISLNTQCHPPLAEPWASQFEPLGARGKDQLYVRKTAP